MRIVVTGGGGFVGRAVVAAAREAGHEPWVLSRRPDAVPGLAADVPRVAADLLDPAALQEAVGRSAPDAVVHAAAIVEDGAPDLLAVNVQGTAHLCAALQALERVPRLVHVSTFSVEDEPPTAYSDSKLAAEEVVRTSGLPFVILRPTLVFGPGDRTNTPALVDRLRAGTHWLPAGGRSRIQPVFVEDLARAVVAAATRPGIEGRTYRLGGPEPISVRAWRSAVRDASGGRAALRTLPLPLLALAARVLALAGRRGPLGVVRFHRADHAVDSSVAQQDLGFRPRPYAEALAATFPGT